MKKLFIISALFLTNTIFAQQKKQFVIEHCIDKMTDTEYYFASAKLICANTQKTKGFTIKPFYKPENSTFLNQGFICENVNIGTCDENDTLIILFDDDTKLSLLSYNDFNCEGNVYFSLSSDELSQLSVKKVKTIRFTNGQTYDTFTHTLKIEQKQYFINAYTNYKIIEINCSN